MFFFFFCTKCAHNRIQRGLESLSAKSPHNQLPIACNPPNIKCINAFIEKAKLYFGINTENSAVYFMRYVNHCVNRTQF